MIKNRIKRIFVWIVTITAIYTALSYFHFRNALAFPDSTNCTITIYRRSPTDNQIEKKLELNQAQRVSLLQLLSNTKYQGFYFFSPKKNAKLSYFDIWISSSSNYSSQFLIGPEFSFSWGNLSKTKLGNTEQVLKYLTTLSN